MEMHPVASSNVHSVGYDPRTETLRVQYHGGTTYEYEGVTQHKHDSLMGSESVGGFLNKHVKGVHPHKLVE